EREVKRGIPAARIALAGFSQGGAIALQTGLRYPEKLAGVMALSTYLPLAALLPQEAAPANKTTSIFMAHGIFDPGVPYLMASTSRVTLTGLGYNVEWHEYPMQHSVCAEEVADGAK